MSAADLLYLSYTFNKPITYFFPKRSVHQKDDEKSLPPLENEILIHFLNVWGDDLKKAAINQVRTFSKFDPIQTLWDAVDITISKKEREAQITEFMEKIGKKPKSK